VKLPRDLDAEKLVRLLERHGYKVTRQTGSHLRLTCHIENDQHHITIPRHGALRVGTLNRILSDVAANLGVAKEDLLP
jgi:predicted RNA binding protein YcfA (HicA-like mRNA interferase family)